MSHPLHLTEQTLPIVMLALLAGCATGPMTTFEVASGDAPAIWEYRDVFWRPAAGAQGGVEVVGYGFVGFYNDPLSRNYDPRWPASGRAVIRMYAISQPGDAMALTLLGPSMTLGPGNDEIITGTAQGVKIEPGEKDQRTITIPPTAVQAGNRPGMALTMNGTIHARQTDDGNFERQLGQFNTERGYRDLPHVTKPEER